MAEIAYILLCHKDVDDLIEKAKSLTSAGDMVAIHFDARSPQTEFDRLKAALAGNDRVTFAKRKRCGWGEWSLVDATLSAIRAAEAAFPRATHFYLVSGDCMPIKSAPFVHDFLDRRDVDYIESVDFFASGWIKTGLRDERVVYRHWFNERSQSKRFYTSLTLQKRLGLKRRVPDGLRMMIGSQWWCLRRETMEAILAYIDDHPAVMRFFRTTWIPDETFFQTLVRCVVPDDQIESRTPTFLMFSDYGMPVTFYNDHYDLLIRQDFLFARKISAEALELKNRLGTLYNSHETDFTISNEGRQLHSFLTSRGRVGERFGPRFWEASGTIGRERTLLIVTCKKWHVAKRLADQIGTVSNLHRIEYLFDENDTALPDLGGIQASLDKRSRHRRAFVRLLFDHYETDLLLICLDPANYELIDDFYADRCTTRLLEIECKYSPEYLKGHAVRVGLASENTSGQTFDGLLPALQNTVLRESERIRDRGWPDYYRIRQDAPLDENAAALASFLGLDRDNATRIAGGPHLFDD